MENNKEQKSEIAKEEEKILEFWKENKIFEESDKKESPNGEFVFYEGPPTANGRPGLHHMEARAFKDVIPRYKTMQGFHVRRKAGWDTHGLPVEIEVEKELGLKSKKEIEEYGIAEFNKKCKESVWKYVDEWEKFTDRVAFWLDEKNPYITYEPEYMESVWNIVKKVDDQKLLYKDYRIVNWCPRCETGLASHELAQGYQEVSDMSVYVKFKVKNPERHNLPKNTYLLAWTTTPWTLPGNVALAINEKVIYGKFTNPKFQITNKSQITNPKIQNETEYVILAVELAKKILSEVEPEEIFSGKDLVGIKYEPLYPYLESTLPETELEKFKNAYKVYGADFVTTEDGTGIVHIAVMYGADDFELGTKVGLPKHHLVNEAGRFILGTDFLEGKKVRGANEEIIENLGDKVFAKERIKHTYPHCWRCKTAVIYFARDSWYIKMSKLRDELVKENKGINWEPEHIKEGRFGEWLREVKDWAVSRERYWATPLPVWQNEVGENVVIGSVEELKKRIKKSGNKYFVMRHGEAESNVLNIVSSKIDNPHHLTEKGREQIDDSVRQIKNKNIDIIITSPFVRTKETAEIVAESIGIKKNEIIIDNRIGEINAGEFNGKPISEYHKYFDSLEACFEKKSPDGENYIDIKKRVGEFIYDVDTKYKEKNILIVTHDVPGWLLFSGISGSDTKKTIMQRGHKEYFMLNAEVKDFDFVPLPHNENYELDLHRPYIDEITLIDKKGDKLTRVKEVMDVWFDSGAMPFAQDHYPFENKELIDGAGYPADYISEAIDQTRGWFYTLHAIGVLTGRGKAYKNVISLGHILDKKGKKMSKSVGNVINPWEMIDKYGVDALRFWMYTVNQPGDSKNFDEKSADDVVKKVFNLLNNIVKFYELYGDNNQIINKKHLKSDNILDQWILARLNNLIVDSTKNLNNYHVFEPARGIRDFIADFSQWYIRRSRDRFKIESEDKENAVATTRFILTELSKLMAPFTPFIAEQVYQKVKSIDSENSVHLESWPSAVFGDKEKSIKLISAMNIVRQTITLALESRSKLGIKVRQPLNILKINLSTKGANEAIREDEQLRQLIKDEVNVKDLIFDKNLNDSIEFDINLTQDLKDEGSVREIIRVIQSIRKKENLTIQDFVSIDIETDDSGRKFIERFSDDIKTVTLVKEFNFVNVEGNDIEIDAYNFRFSIKKI